MKKRSNYIDYFQLNNPLTKIKSVISYKARMKIYNHFLLTVNPSLNDVVLDMGVTPDTILIESNFFEKKYPYTDQIVMSSIEDASNLELLFKGTKFVKIDKKMKFPFKDKQFDILFCSAVLEHVGTNNDQKIFINECVRVAKKIYITTPNKFCPIEFHTYLPFIHYLPRKIHQKILKKINLDFWSDINNLNLLTKKMILSLLSNDLINKTKIYYNKIIGIKTNIIIYIEDF